MDFGTTGGSKVEVAANAANTAGVTGSSPVGDDENNQAPKADKVLTSKEQKQEELDKPFTYKRSITVSLIQNYSLYRKANDKVLPKKRDYIGSSIRSSQVLASNRAEVEAYFPQLLGISVNNENFVTRLKQYLNNIQVPVNELGVTFDCSFRFNHKRDYFAFKAREEEIEMAYKKANKQSTKDLRAALAIKINDLNNLESEQYAVGSPVNITDYILYRHCLLYRDIAKDTALINCDPFVRFYLKDDAKDKERQQKLRQEINNAKRNYIEVIGDDEMFDAVYIQYCVVAGLPIVNSLLSERMDKESQLDKFSTSEPVKFNSIVKDRDLRIKSLIELLIARGEFVRSQFNQNITTQDGEFIGANMKEAIAWAKNPENENVLAAFKNKLKYI
ncbi:hypothetical protein [uncultured phage cr91_1]|uniref:Uncharacterized protein n=1 Tax=uncultured phage cr91_1 TaxID=2986403 RepID=A0AAE7V2E4_9CAUD|nr:hypothetical protein M1M48_gp74 [uncultured phage cr91_1]QWM89634.1 hypothetical protein [uncultured phage cr91_1]